MADCKFHPEHSWQTGNAHWAECVLNADVCPEEQIMDALDDMSGVGKENCLALLMTGQAWVGCMDNSTLGLQSDCDHMFPTQTQICECMSHVPEDVAWEFDCKFHPEHSTQMIHAYWAQCTHEADTCEGEDIVNEIGRMSGRAEENCNLLLGQAVGWVECMDDPERSDETCEAEALPTNEVICDCLGAMPEDIAWEFGLWRGASGGGRRGGRRTPQRLHGARALGRGRGRGRGRAGGGGAGGGAAGG